MCTAVPILLPATILHPQPSSSGGRPVGRCVQCVCVVAVRVHRNGLAPGGRGLNYRPESAETWGFSANLFTAS